MSLIDLAYFEDFKEEDVLLFHSTHAALPALAEVMRHLSLGGPSVAIDELSFVQSHGVTVRASAGTLDQGVRKSGSHFTWVRSSEAWRSLSAQVASIPEKQACHLYLDGPDDEVSVMLSVDQYSQALFHNVG